MCSAGEGLIYNPPLLLIIDVKGLLVTGAMAICGNEYKRYRGKIANVLRPN